MKAKRRHPHAHARAELLLSVPNSVAAAGKVRSAIRLLRPDVGAVYANLVLLTSEAVANTVTWSAGGPLEPISVRVIYGFDRARVEVTDRAGPFTGSVLPTDGHELWRSSLLARLSLAWGVGVNGSGTFVWFELDARR